MLLTGLALGLLVGLSLGLLGGGGSVLTVPIFVYVLGIPTKSAIAMSLAVVAVSSMFGAAGHWRAGNIHLRMALAFAMFTTVASLGGAAVANRISGDAQLLIFAIVMLTAAIFMFRGRRDGAPAADELSFGRSAAKVGPPALGVGFLTGLIGVGGGFLIVPVLVLLARVPMKKAIGSSLVVIAITSVVAFAAQLAHGVEVRWGFMALFTAIAVVGILAGAALVPRIPQERLRKGFAVFLVLMALLILYQKGAHLLG